MLSRVLLISSVINSFAYGAPGSDSYMTSLEKELNVANIPV